MESVSERSSASDLEIKVRLAQKLARDLRAAPNARRAYEISHRLARVSRDLEEATRNAYVIDGYDEDMEAVD
jgi:hypothetical protein